MHRFGSRSIRIGAGLALILLMILAGQPAPVAATNIVDYYLVGPAGAGGTITPATSGAGLAAVGRSGGGTYYATAQTFVPYPGLLTEFKVTFGANVGAPSSTVDWAVVDNIDGNFGSVMDSGSFTPTASAENTISPAGTAFLLNKSYWLRFVPTIDQTAGNYWQIIVSNLNPYADGAQATYFYKSPQIGLNPPNDMVCSITTEQGASPDAYSNDALAQAFTVSSDLVISGVSLDLKKVGSPTGTLTYTVETDAANHPSGVILTTATTAESGLSTTYGPIALTFASNLTLVHGTRYWQKLVTDRESTTDYVIWAAAEFYPLSNDFLVVHNQLSSIWIPQSAKAIYELTVESGATPAADTSQYLVLASGQSAAIDYTLTAGDSLISLLLLVLIGLVCFSVVVLATKRRR